MQVDQLAEEAMQFGSDTLKEPEASKTLDDRLKVLQQITRLLSICGESRSVVNQFHHSVGSPQNPMGGEAA